MTRVNLSLKRTIPLFLRSPSLLSIASLHVLTRLAIFLLMFCAIILTTLEYCSIFQLDNASPRFSFLTPLALLRTSTFLKSPSLFKASFFDSSNQSSFNKHQQLTDSTLESFRQSSDTWISYLSSIYSNNNISTVRSFCRELDAHGQSCVFDGLMCVDVRTSHVHIADDSHPDYSSVSSDDWCKLRHMAADPRYMSSRQWPLLTNTFAPQRSCLSSSYRNSSILKNIAMNSTLSKWVPRLSLVNLDYEDNPHNNHLLKDIAWLLDVSLFQDSLLGILHDLEAAEAAEAAENTYVRKDIKLFSPHEHILLPQTKEQFLKQTGKDINRLTYALVMRKPLRNLYSNSSTTTKAIPLLDAYPELQSQLIFKPSTSTEANRNQSNKTFICTPRLVVGAKMGDLGHERVCRYMRARSYKQFGIVRPQVTRSGQIRYPQPPRKLIILDRHITRRIGNVSLVVKELTDRMRLLGVDVHYVTTASMVTAQDVVKIFSSGGVVLTPHGSQNMGVIWMQRFSALIEIMPVGYTDYAFNLLSNSCRVWHYELPSALPKNLTDYYEEKCGGKIPHMMTPCTDVKFKDVFINVDKAYELIVFAFERLGHDMRSWLNDTI